MTMKLNIPQGGFFVAKKNDDNIGRMTHGLVEKGFSTKVYSKDNIVLAALKDFEGQGIWIDSDGCVAYDLDLTNTHELSKLTGQSIDSQGALLWALYKKFDTAFLDKLRGAFAFALWDDQKKKLFVATDYFGIRPVVYSEKNGEYLAASRIRTLLIDRDISRQIHPDAVYHYLFFQAICSPLSIYKGVGKLEPGKYHAYDNGNLQEIRYYDIEYSPDNSLQEKEWTRRIFTEVEKAVNIYLPLTPHEKTGCFLSGGTDSSTIAGLYGRLSGKPAQTFSIGFDDPKYNELEYAELAVKKFGTKQTEHFVTPEDTFSLISELCQVYDEPFGNASVVAAFYCAQAAKQKGVDVLLGGDGGDEIFGGNERYVTNLVFERYFLIPKSLRQYIMEPLLKILPDTGVFHKASRYIRRANFSNPDRFFSYNMLAEKDHTSILTQSFMDEVNPDSFMSLARAHYQRVSPAHDTNRLLYMDMKFTITDNDLHKVTQMVEAAGIQVQYPYLDRDLVDFTGKIPPELKVKYGKNRYIFKKAMEGFLPDEIIHKSKHGMGLPISNWFRTEKMLNELMMDHLFSGSPEILNYIRPSFLNNIFNSFKEDDTTAYYGDTLWVYLVLELWLKNNKSIVS